ncbi:MAG: DUF2255 family protein [Actinobacteria bacterium]|nr:MAG: DUF2255 family protein [Actinomycetota bacterium]
MAPWESADLDRIEAAQELEIAPRRGDGSLRTPVPIWVVRAGDDLYVRAAHGDRSGWHRVARNSCEARIYAAVAGVAATVGLVAGGMFAGWLSWRVGFFINVPLGLAMIVAAPRYLPETAPEPGQADVAGALSSTLGMTALV